MGWSPAGPGNRHVHGLAGAWHRPTSPPRRRNLSVPLVVKIISKNSFSLWTVSFQSLLYTEMSGIELGGECAVRRSLGFRTWTHARRAPRTAGRWDTRSCACHTWCRWPCARTRAGHSRWWRPCRYGTGGHLPHPAAAAARHLKGNRELGLRAQRCLTGLGPGWARCRKRNNPASLHLGSLH